MRILISRTDRIGDLVLSTPVFEAIKKHLPDASTLVMARKGTIDVISDNPFVDEYITYDPMGAHKGFSGALALSKTLRQKHIDIAVELFMSFYPALAVRLAGVKKIIGPGSRIYSFALLTDVIQQHRKESQYNEAAYNLMLLKPLGVNEMNIKPRVYLSDNQDSCEKFLLNQGVKPFNYFVVHPGMGGSAKNLSVEKYVTLIRAMTERYKLPVVLTGSYVDHTAVNRITAELHDNPQVKDMCCVLSMHQLKMVLFFAKAMIGPSTGPMHISAALGRPTVAVFSPIKAQSATRWSPYLLRNAAVVEPEIGCTEQYTCNKKCLHYNCMDSISIEKILKKVEELIAI
ncbi:MAG: glycosyltransferase family 9 protein [Deltaproteobacteria bacterium]|nr:glycosyltransferase family 9 protein [Deltaproteobacteria bacterium]